MKKFLSDFTLHKYYQKVLPLLVLVLAAQLTSCKKFLDEKPDKNIIVATTLKDAQALLDNYNLFNSFYPSIGDQSDDNFFLNDETINALSLSYKNNYLWEKDAINEFEWNVLYEIILNATIAQETVEKIPKDRSDSILYNSIEGTAFFYRGYALFQVAQYYADIYDSVTAGGKLGIPLRKSSDGTIMSKRSTLAETWEHIANNFIKASRLLPLTSPIPSRPTKAAAWAALARTYLYMDKYQLAYKAADSALYLKSTLINFNTLDSTLANPFTRFNDEVIFPSTSMSATQLYSSVYSIDTTLYASYEKNDLRRVMYFELNDNKGYGFKANLDGDNYSGPFNGLAVDEILLIRAECLARMGAVDKAMDDLNTLLRSRWKAGYFIPFSASSPEDALNTILIERRKELILRGTRWFDLRRLGKDSKHAVELIRLANGIKYTLGPNSSRYTFLIPKQVIDITGMKQNTR